MIYTIDEVADILKVSPNTVRKLIRDKEIKSFRVGNQIRVRKEDLDDYIRRQQS